MTMNFENMPQTLEKWHELGYEAETLPLVFYAPLVQVAWAEGFLQGGERRKILEFARENSLAEDLIYDELLVWLDERPPDYFFAAATEILRELLAELPPAEAEAWREKLQAACLEVAGSSPSIGVLRNRDRISREERREIEQIGNNLGFSAV
jgi:hypothetical protein